MSDLTKQMIVDAFKRLSPKCDWEDAELVAESLMKHPAIAADYVLSSMPGYKTPDLKLPGEE